MAYRIYDPAPVYFDMDGLTPCAGGKIYTYEAGGTTSPKTSWSDEALTVPNSNPITLDSAGRANTNIWGDGAYTQVLEAADGRRVWVREVTSGIPAGAAIPTLETGMFLTNDGSNLIWVPVLEVPDPSDSAGYQLGTDGANVFWEPKQEIPEPPEADVSATATMMRVGDYGWQFGEVTIPASSSKSSSAAVTFPVPFLTLEFANFVSTVSDIGTHGVGATQSIGGVVFGSAATGMTVTLNSADDGGDSGRDIAVPVKVRWSAYGKVRA